MGGGEGLRIDGGTRLSRVLDGVPGALEYVVGLNPHDFARLRNPVLRKYMAGRISLRRVAAMAGVPENDLVARLRALAGVDCAASAAPAAPAGEVLPMSPGAAPAWLAGADPDAVRWVDVLPIDAVGGDPFPAISLGVRQLAPGEVLGIRHRWEPQPLYDIWAKMSLEWYARPAGADGWHVFVYRPPEVAGAELKPVVGAVVAHLPVAEVVPRLVGLAQQLRPGQVLEVSGLPAPAVPEVWDAVLRALGPGYAWSPAAPGPDGAGGGSAGRPAECIVRVGD
jgi:hypothetical protein